jgi:RNA polymerase sigma factor (sigma-70 family)
VSASPAAADPRGPSVAGGERRRVPARNHPSNLDKPRSFVLSAPVPHGERDPWKSTLEQALGGDRQSIGVLIDGLGPVIQARVVRVLRRLGGVGRRDLRQEMEDLTQDVFAQLFAERGRALAAWDAERGLSLPNYVGLIAERHVYSLFRVDKRRPFREQATEAAAFERRGGGEPGPERTTASRQLLDRLLDRMRDSVTPLGLQIFQLAYVQEKEVADVARLCGITEDAVYIWRSRLRKRAAELLEELERVTAPQAGAEVVP